MKMLYLKMRTIVEKRALIFVLSDKTIGYPSYYSHGFRASVWVGALVQATVANFIDVLLTGIRF